MQEGAIFWRFKEMEWEGSWSWTGHTGELWAKVCQKIGQIETMTWVQAQQGRRAPLKAIDVGSLCAEAQTRLQDIRHDDFDSLWELHIDGPTRIWGLKVGEAFCFLWCDPEHEVCPSSLRRT